MLLILSKSPYNHDGAYFNVSIGITEPRIALKGNPRLAYGSAGHSVLELAVYDINFFLDRGNIFLQTINLATELIDHALA